MAESYSVKAILSAQDKGFTSAFKSAMGTVSNLKNTLTSGIGFGIMAGIGQKAFGAVTSSIGGMVSELNSSSAAWKTFNGNMSMVGKGADEIASVKKELQEFAEDTIYSASDMASTYAQLSAVGIKSTNKLVKGFGGLAAAAENPKQAMKTLSQQATQMAAKPTVAWADFKLMIEQTPAGISAVAKEMGMTTTELVQNVQDGKIATEDFFDAIAKVGTNDAFTKLATEYKTVDQAMDGLTETVSNKLAPSFDVLSGRAIKSLDGIINKIGDLDGDAIAGKLTGFLDKASGYWNVLKTEALEVKTAFGDAFSAIGEDLGKITGAFGSTESISSFAGVMDSASGALQTFAGFLKEHSEIIAKVISKLPRLFVAYKGFKIAKSVAPFVGAFTSAIAGLAGAGISAIAGKLFGISKGQRAVGESSETSAKGVTSLKEGFNSLQKSAGIALIVSALAGFALAVKPLAELGTTAVPSLLTFGVVVGGLATILGTMGKKLQESAVGIGVFAGAVSVMALSMTPLAKTGTDGAIAMAAFGVVVAGLVAVFAIFGTALTAAIPAMLSFGATVLMVGAGMNLASSLISALIPFVRQLGDTVSQVATSIAFSISMILSAFGDLVSTVADAVGTIVATVGNTLVNVVKTAGDVISDVVESISDGFRTITDGISGVIDAIGGAFSSVLESVADVINSIGNSAKNAGKGFKSVAEGIQIISELSIIDIAKSLGAVAIGLGEISSKGKGLKEAAAGVEVMVVSITSASTQLALFNMSLQKMGSLSVSVASGITAIKKAFAGFSVPPVDTSRITASFRSIVSSANMVAVQVSATGKNTANNYASAMAFGFRKAATETMSGVSKIKDAAGKLATLLPKTAVQAMNGFNNAFSSGKTKAISIAKAMATSVVSAMKSAQGGAYNSGYYIGVGLANGMEASLGRVRSIAAQLAEAAEKAIRAKAKIHSPSRVSEELGEYYGDGWIGGIQRRMKEAYHVVKELVSIPAVDEPRLAVAGYGTVKDLDEGYSYNRNATYTIVVPVEVDGREIAKVTAPYTQEELNKLEKRNNRKRGFR